MSDIRTPKRNHIRELADSIAELLNDLGRLEAENRRLRHELQKAGIDAPPRAVPIVSENLDEQIWGPP